MSDSCKGVPFKHLYDKYIESSFFGGLEPFFFEPLDASRRSELIPHQYIVNKSIQDVLKWQSLRYSYHFKVFDHIRVIEEILTGIFTTDNKEFNLIIRPFLKEFMLGNIYITYSEEIKNYELNLVVEKAKEEKRDYYEALEKSYPLSTFRLFRRIHHEGTYRWDAVLSGLQNVQLEEFLMEIHLNAPELSGQDPFKKLPIRLTYNEGFMFVRLFEIFKTYEAQMQTHDKLFQSLHKIGDINAENYGAVQAKAEQFESPQVFTYTTSDKEATTVENLELIQHLTQIKESYDIIQTRLNDALGRLGLAGDDSTKAERITTGENFRALQPNMAFQQAVLQSLNNASHQIKERLGQQVNFTNNLEPNEQGIPTLAGEAEPQGQPGQRKQTNESKG